MIFSKSFGYAVRSVLYIAHKQNERRFIHVEEIASVLAIPRYFMGKILKKMAKEGVLFSTKGPTGGFTVNERTLTVSLLRLVDLTNGLSSVKGCVLRMKECNGLNPCPLHYQMEEVKSGLRKVLSETTIGDLLLKTESFFKDDDSFITSISSLADTPLIK